MEYLCKDMCCTGLDLFGLDLDKVKLTIIWDFLLCVVEWKIFSGGFELNWLKIWGGILGHFKFT